MEKEHVLKGDLEVQEFKPQSSGDYLLTPDTQVLCIHRGRRELVNGQPVRHPDAGREEHYYRGDIKDTFDSKHYVIAPGYFSAPLGAALHLKARAVVPGSRNPELRYQSSFVAILGIAVPTTDGLKIVKQVDPPDDWPAFTDEECTAYGMAVEALDREHMTNPIDGEVSVVATSEALAGRKTPVGQAKPSRVKGGTSTGGGRTRGRATDIQTTDDSILEPIRPEDNRTVQQIARDRAAAASGKDE